MVDCGKPSREVVRLLIGSRHSDAKSNALSCCRHGRDYRKRLSYRPLSSGGDRGLKRLGIDIVAT